jgi:hypothetical protein
MSTYQITSDLAGFSRKRQWLSSLLGGGLFAAILMIIDVLWHSSASSGHLLGDLTDAVVGGVIFVFVDFACFKRKFDYKVVISDDCITAIHSRYQRSVRRNEIKTVAEFDGNLLMPPSLLISKYGRFGTRLWGCISIPKTLPEYENIRTLALSWKGAR